MTERTIAAAAAHSARTGGEVRIERVFDAPRDLVFAAWTDARHFSQWCAPARFRIIDARIHPRRGGVWWSRMQAPDGEECTASGVYREILAPERLVFTYAHDAPDGSRGPETLVTVTFEDRDGRTLLVLHQATFDTVANRDGHYMGWNECLDRLADQLPEMHA